MVRKTYSVIIEGEEHEVVIEKEGSSLRVSAPEEDETLDVSVQELDEALYLTRLGREQRTFGMEKEQSTYTITLGGRVFEADVCDSRFRDAEARAKAPGETGELSTITASIPGQVLDICVAEGDQLEVGDTVLLLSAMKLENEIQADQRGVVETICVEPDETVEKGQPLIEVRN